ESRASHRRDVARDGRRPRVRSLEPASDVAVAAPRGGGSAAKEKPVIRRTGLPTRPTGSPRSGRRGPYRPASPPPARHRPGARSARLGDVVTILPQTNRERENEPCHSPVGCDISDPPGRRANVIAGGGPRIGP